ncbi:uncharacterized protein LOC111457833 isoform X1 [Cucurbita moschata]|uniref:Uncharacterized protein LOC111457833 isoform X1 n=2 Tax=Cucurbita moschata TaxID=3662 RepID=A0A6J1GXU8_CUCMO|nr:uncharacterized protein LOC111457833 isoform X1 [Cucurbita moschata]
MGEGEESKTRAEAGVEIQERGEIFFFYRPKVGKQQVHGPDDVQRLYIILRPESGERAVEEKQLPNASSRRTQEVNIEKQPLLRFMIMGRKSLPNPAQKRRPYWGFVDMVTTNVQDVKAALQEGEYDSSTRGHRHISAARAVGEGIYRLVRHKQPDTQKSKKSYHTHLIYKLEFPSEDEENEPQNSFNIGREGSFLIMIKNPDVEGDGSRNKRRAQFPAHLQGEFGHTRFHPADPPDYLNFEGCEFLLISASDDIEQELGLELTTAPHECDLVKMFGETTSTQPLLKGTWV